MDEVSCHACGKIFDSNNLKEPKYHSGKPFHLKCLRKIRRIAKKKYVYGTQASMNAALEDYRRKIGYEASK